MHIEGVNNAEGQFVRLAFPCKAARLLHRDDLTCRLKLIEEEDEELVEQLSDTGGVSRRSDVFLLDDAEVGFEEGIGLDHAEDARVGIASLASSIVRSAALLRFQFLNRHGVVNCLGLLSAQLALLKAWKDRRLSALQEGNDHECQRVGREVPIGCSDDLDSLRPVLQEGCQDVEALIYLAVRIDEV